MLSSVFPVMSKKIGDNIIDFDTHEHTVEQLVKGMLEPGDSIQYISVACKYKIYKKTICYKPKVIYGNNSKWPTPKSGPEKIICSKFAES